jgi:hypothetical protein
MSNQKRKPKSWSLALALLAAVLLGLLVGAAVYAQTGGLSLPWFTVDGGGITSSGGAYTLSGTMGQPDAGLLSGGAYRLTGGLWSAEGAVDQPYTLHLPVTRR